MKKLRVIMRVVGVLLVGVMMYSCSEPAVDEISSENLKTKWEKSLYNAMYIAECKTLSLEGYKYLGDVTTEEGKQALLDEIFSDKEYMVAANYEANTFDIMTYGERINLTPLKNKNLYAPRKSNVTKGIENRSIGVVELKWNYLGENKFTSKAIVATDGEQEFLYDNILSYAPVDNQPKETRTVKDLTTRSSSTKAFDLESIRGDHGPMTLCLEYAWEYEIYVRTDFNSEGTFINKLMTHDEYSYCGWDCASGVMTVSGEVNKSKYHEFMWGYVYGENMDVSISNGGLGLIISAPPGATSGSATEMHNSYSVMPPK